MARFDGPIYSYELDRRFFLQERETLTRSTQVRISLTDSRAFLRDLLLDLPKDQRTTPLRSKLPFQVKR